MGNCLGKKRKCKRNAVAPAPEEDVDLCERISRATPRPGCSSLFQAEMYKQLDESEFEKSKIAAGGVSFVLDLSEGNPARMPSRLASRMDGACTPAMNDDEVHYTASERELIAELNREDIFRIRRAKARRDVEIYDAARRRATRKLVAESETSKAEDQTNE